MCWLKILALCRLTVEAMCRKGLWSCVCIYRAKADAGRTATNPLKPLWHMGYVVHSFFTIQHNYDSNNFH